MIVFILKIIGSIILTLIGLGWMYICYLGVCMSDAPVEHPLKEICIPASFGLIPIAVAVLIWVLKFK